MFSSMIQNLLSSSGQASAMQRAVQMKGYADSLNAQWAPVEKADASVVNKHLHLIKSYKLRLKLNLEIC